MYQTLANIVLVAHVGVVLFVVGGLVLVWVGNGLAWPWVNRLWFRLLHLATIAYVAAQAWLDQTCPLTTLESWLRQQAGETDGQGYAAGFIAYWFQKILFYEAPSWVFTLAYSAFALAVAASWWRFPPTTAAKTTRSPKPS